MKIIITVCLLIVLHAIPSAAAPDKKQAGLDTALFSAITTNHTAAVRLLLKQGAHANALDGHDGVTALMAAVASGHPALVQLLLSRGANARAIMKNGDTVLIVAAVTGNVDALRLILAQGVDVNAKGRAGSLL